MTLEVHQFPCLSDNYGYLLHDPDSGETACIDTPDAEAYLREAAAKGWRITQIWNTHWHPDHAGGNAAIKASTGCTITAPAVDAPKMSKPPILPALKPRAPTVVMVGLAKLLVASFSSFELESMK